MEIREQGAYQALREDRARRGICRENAGCRPRGIDGQVSEHRSGMSMVHERLGLVYSADRVLAAQGRCSPHSPRVLLDERRLVPAVRHDGFFSPRSPSSPVCADSRKSATGRPECGAGEREAVRPCTFANQEVGERWSDAWSRRYWAHRRETRGVVWRMWSYDARRAGTGNEVNPSIAPSRTRRI